MKCCLHIVIKISSFILASACDMQEFCIVVVRKYGLSTSGSLELAELSSLTC